MPSARRVPRARKLPERIVEPCCRDRRGAVNDRGPRFTHAPTLVGRTSTGAGSAGRTHSLHARRRRRRANNIASQRDGATATSPRSYIAASPRAHHAPAGAQPPISGVTPPVTTVAPSTRRSSVWKHQHQILFCLNELNDVNYVTPASTRTTPVTASTRAGSQCGTRGCALCAT